MAPDHSPGRGRWEHPSPRVIDVSARFRTYQPPDRDRCHVIVVEDDPLIADLITGILEEDPGFVVERAPGLDGALARMVRDPVDLVISELNFNDSVGPEAVRLLRRAAPDAPLVVLSEIDDVEVAARAIREGADEYVVKGRFSVTSFLWLIRLVMERHHGAGENGAQEYTDPVTGLANGPALQLVGRHLLRVAERAGLGCGVVFVGLHASGEDSQADLDRLLGQVRDKLQQTVRRCDFLAHVERGELATLLVSRGPVAPAVTRFERAIGASSVAPFVRLGFAVHHPDDPVPVDDLLARARDRARPVTHLTA